MMLRRAALLSACTVTLLAAAGCKKETPEEKTKKEVAEALANGTKTKSVAREHLPDNCQLAISVDWPRFRELKAVKDDIEREIGKLEAPPIPNAPIDPETAADIKQFKEFLAKTQIDIRKDPGELAVCVWKLDQQVPGQTPSFVAILGGQFIPGAAAEALNSFPERLKALLNRARAGAPPKPAPEIIEIQGVKVAYDKVDGIYLSQAKDGAFIIANDRPAFEKALGTSKAHEAYKLPPEPMGVAISAAGASVFAPQLQQSPLAPLAASFAAGSMGMTDGQVLLRIEVKDAAVLAPAQATLGAMIHPDPRMPPNPFTQAMAGAKVTTAGTVLTIELPIPEAMTQGMLQQAGVGARPMPPGAMPPGAMPPGAMPPGAMPPGARPLPPPGPTPH